MLLTSLQILILIFAEVLGLYGLIVALIMNTNGANVANTVTVRSFTSLPMTTSPF